MISSTVIQKLKKESKLDMSDLKYKVNSINLVDQEVSV